MTAPSSRKLVHWINSLPLASCLLVDALDELRLGDALLAITRWLQDDHDDNDNDHDHNDDGPLFIDDDPRAAVTRVVDFVAPRCCAVDGDAMYVVHSASCVARILAGDVAAITAVVTVLRRLATEKDTTARVQTAAQAQQRRRHVTRAVTVRASEAVRLTKGAAASDEVGRPRDDATARPTAPNINAKATPRPTTTHRPVGRAPSLLRVVNDENETRASNPNGSPNGSHTYQPPVLQKARTPRRPLTAAPPTGPTGSSVSNAERDSVLAWMDALGIRSSPSLCDGVALCALAAVVARRRGSMAVRHTLHTTAGAATTMRTNHSQRSVLFPRRATLEPRTHAERRHNLTTAWSLLAACCVLPTAVVERTPEQLVELVDEKCGHTNGKTIWSILLHVQKQLQQQEQQPPSRAVRSAAFVLDESDVVGQTKRPYMTAEQIHVVQHWMKGIGVDPMAISSGILDDGLRNGVALCRLLQRTIPTATRGRLTYHDPPKTLIEVRSNIHAALGTLVSLREVMMTIPTVYLTKQAVERIATGDRQLVYGLLWHFMQVCKAHDARPSITPVVERPPVSEEIPSLLPGLQVQQATTTEKQPSKPLPRVVSDTTPTVTSILLDVPACQLVDEEDRDSGVIASTVGWRSVPWETTSLLDGCDNIVPMAQATTAIDTAEPDHDVQDDIVPRQYTLGSTDLDSPVNRPRPQLLPHDDDLPSPPDPSVVSELSSRPPATQARVLSSPPSNATGIISATTNNGSSPQAALDCDTKVVASETLEPDTDILPSSPRAPATEFSTTQLHQLVQWLRHIGIVLVNVDAFQDPTARLTEFSSGILLCSIVEKLEHMRSMDGVCRDKTVAQAQALHNIDKALDVLRRKKTVPLAVLRRRRQIYEGDRTTIVTLLVHMRKAYGHHVRAPSVGHSRQEGNAVTTTLRPS